MVNKHFVVVWPIQTRKQLQKVYSFIKKDSFQNAEKVKKGILEATSNLAINPEIYPRDKYKIDNDGSFRVFELYRYCISYQIINDEVVIIRIRHTSMNPKKY